MQACQTSRQAAVLILRAGHAEWLLPEAMGIEVVCLDHMATNERLHFGGHGCRHLTVPLLLLGCHLQFHDIESDTHGYAEDGCALQGHAADCISFAEMLALRRANASALSSELAATAKSWSVLR